MTEEHPELREYLARLGLPPSLAEREPELSQKVLDLFLYHRQQVQQEHRNFHLGLMFAFVAVTEECCTRLGVDSCPTVLADYPPLETRGGRRLNTLTLPVPGGRPIGLRGYYNKIERAIRYWLRRLSYPSMAPHATQAWAQHRYELEQVTALSSRERAGLVELLWKETLDIPRPSYRSAAEARPRSFAVTLEGFNAAPAEPAGVVLQSLAYAYFNVELMHLTAVESDKVRSGGARSGNVGDIDGWDASELVEAIEVKDLDLDEKNQHELAGFLDNLTNWPDATAIVVARNFSPAVVASLKAQNVLPLTRAQMIEDVRTWDMERQRRAVRAMDYYIVRVQAHPGLEERFRDFLVEHNIGLD